MLYRFIPLFVVLAILTSCDSDPSAQEIVDKAIEVSGGERYASATVAFYFRDRLYRLTREKDRRVLWRHTFTDSGEIVDRKAPAGFERSLGGKQLSVADSMARKYGNSINSVHYFAYLPYGLNDEAVIKSYLGRTRIKGQEYDMVEIRFKERGGGEDFEDVFYYWFHTTSGKPDYLAYEYHTDGGGVRFRAAKNERYVNGIRFVDYENYKPRDKGTPLSALDSLYDKGALQLLSKIELDSIRVIPGNYN